MSCLIDNSPYAVEIAGWLRQGLSSTTVNENLQSVDVSSPKYTKIQISRHRTQCLGMAPLQGGRPHVATSQKPEDLEKQAKVSNDEILALSKIAFFDRLKKHPHEIKTSELVSVISALTRDAAKSGKQDDKDPLTTAMGEITGNG